MWGIFQQAAKLSVNWLDLFMSSFNSFRAGLEYPIVRFLEPHF